MGIDYRRCVEAAVHAAFAEAFMRPSQQPGRRRRRRFRPVRAIFRLVRISLMGVGVVTTMRVVRDAEFRKQSLEALSTHLPLEGLLEEIAVEVEAARAALADQAEAEAVDDVDKGARKTATQRARRTTATRSRGDTNGQRKRKPPNRGTRAA